MPIKDVRSQEGEVCLVRSFCEQREFLQMRTSTLFDAKTSDFSKFMVCSQGKTVWTSADILRTRVRRQFFVILCERLLWTALIKISVLRNYGS